EHPGVQLVHRPVTEWLFRGLARTGNVAVRRDRDVAEDLVGHGALRPRITAGRLQSNRAIATALEGPPPPWRRCASSTPPGWAPPYGPPGQPGRGAPRMPAPAKRRAAPPRRCPTATPIDCSACTNPVRAIR